MPAPDPAESGADRADLKPPRYASAPLATKRMPPGIPYIIGNEAAERFSFYGMRTILTVFMVHYLWLMGDSPGHRLSEAEATERFHHFVFLVYLTPVFGALLADLFFGKYRVIMALSIVYCCGHAALAVMGLAGETTLWLAMGLWLIAIGSGGIKPCVSAHVGDQFGASNRHLIPRVFNWFYWSINLGAFLSTLLTPWLLEWYGPHWAFGVPGALMALATAVFWMGRWKFVHIPPKGMGFVRELLSAEGIKAILKLSTIYVFVAVFWALFDQSGSSWVLQAENMDRRWLGIEWLPSQIQALNPILILIFIPLFSYVVYPAIDRFWPLTPLRKIGIGLFVMVIAFGLVAVAQARIDAGGTPSISWQIVAYIFLTASEVMVSIVCLEFSYTQAPRAMKSAIMSIFLVAVSAGNLFTAQINRFIQVPDPTAKIEAVATEVALGGHDGRTGTEDDIHLRFDPEGVRVGIDFRGKEELDTLLDEIAAAVEAKGFVALSPAEAADLLAERSDPWGRPYEYELVNRDRMRLISLGPDGRGFTPWDQGAALVILRPASRSVSPFESWMSRLRPERTWLEARKEALGVRSEAEAARTAPEFERVHFVGGRVRLQGAAYFWFFTALMLASALLFVLVAKLYRPRDYLHDDSPEAEALEREDEAEALGEGATR